MSVRWLAVLWILWMALAAGCAVGPDYQRPATQVPPRFTATVLPDALVGGDPNDNRTQRFVDAATPVAWWSAFGSAEIDALVERALQQSPTIAAAQAALRQAQELTAAQRGAYFPVVSAGYTPMRSRVPQSSASPLSSGASLYTLHTAQVSVGYLFDVFGANRRAAESLEAQEQAQAWQLQAARLTLAANVVNATLQEAALRDQLVATVRLVGISQRLLEMMKTQQRLGEISGASVLAQEALLRQAEATLPALRKQIALERDLLALLVGTVPADLPAPALALDALRLPDVPTGLPGQLVEQRPDVRVAEAQLRAANAEVGVATANMLPQISLTANYGASAEALRNLFSAGSLLWGVGANVAQPLFDGGALLHRKRASEAQLEQALAQYRSTVLTAFQNVADALEAVRYDAEQRLAASRQESAAQSSLHMATRQLELGDVSRLVLLNSESSYLQATLMRIQVQASQFADVCAVYQSLGGSWNVAQTANR